MSEAKLAKEMRKGVLINCPTAHISFVESGLTSAGIPDMDVCILGNETHVELKYGYRERPPHLRPSQYKWFMGRIKAGGSPWLFAKIWSPEGYTYCLYEANTVLELRGRLPNFKWIAMADFLWRENMDWGDIVDLLQRA